MLLTYRKKKAGFLGFPVSIYLVIVVVDAVLFPVVDCKNDFHLLSYLFTD